MRRGFYTGLAAALTLFALSGLWLLSTSQSYRDVSDLAQLQALRVFETASDARAFLSSAVADAEGDAAFSVHGCVAQGTFCSHAQGRVSNYTDASAFRMSGNGMAVRASLFNWSCLPVFPAPAGFSEAYAINVSLNVSVDAGPVSAVRWINQSDVVLVNSTAAFRSVVNSSGPAGIWDVRVNC